MKFLLSTRKKNTTFFMSESCPFPYLTRDLVVCCKNFVVILEKWIPDIVSFNHEQHVCVCVNNTRRLEKFKENHV